MYVHVYVYMFVGLISRVLPVEKVVPEAIKCAEKIAAQSKLAVKFAKLAVDKGSLSACTCTSTCTCSCKFTVLL